VGGSVLFSISLGRKDYNKAEHVLSNTLTMIVLLTAAVAFTWRMFLTPLLGLLGASGSVLPLARDYMNILLLGAPVQGIAMGMNNMLRATGRPKLAMLTMIIGAVMNCILGPLFIFGFHWGMKGAALAVVLSQSISMTWTLFHFLNPKARYRIRAKYLVPVFKIVKQIAAIGSSQFVMNSAICALNIILNLTLVHYGGDLAISAMGIVTSVNTLTIMPVIGIAQGLQPILGYYYGARYHKRMIQFLRTGIKWATFITCGSFILIMLFARQLAHVFSGDEALIKLASHALRTFNMFVPLVGFQVVGGTFFQATAQPVKALILVLSRQILVLIPLIIILPLFMGLYGVFISGPAADGVVSVITFFLLRREIKKYIK
jgi:putative MATE family efflux protein